MTCKYLQIISHLTTGMNSTELLIFFKLWSLCSNIYSFYTYCRNWIVGYLKAVFLKVPLDCTLWNKGSNRLLFSLKQWTY